MCSLLLNKLAIILIHFVVHVVHYQGAEWTESLFCISSWFALQQHVPDQSAETAALLVSDGHMSHASLTWHRTSRKLKFTLTWMWQPAQSKSKQQLHYSARLGETHGSCISVYVPKPPGRAAGFNWSRLQRQPSKRSHEHLHVDFKHNSWMSCISRSFFRGLRAQNWTSTAWAKWATLVNIFVRLKLKRSADLNNG